MDDRQSPGTVMVTYGTGSTIYGTANLGQRDSGSKFTCFNWCAGQGPSGVTGGGTVTAAADGSRFVWSPGGTGMHVRIRLVVDRVVGHTGGRDGRVGVTVHLFGC
ncbi:hypothetical protein ABT009_12665 [Streptomyces sp. NPDC002896]|uniref:hypothetical protein n=1 Tax=Streptomyces sp. NPDC002896 TaxID=3154438 RepID=UPI00331E5C8D